MKRNAKTAIKRKNKFKPFGTCRLAIPKPTITFPNKKAKQNKNECRNWRSQ